MNRVYILLTIVAFVIGGYFFITNNKKGETTPTTPQAMRATILTNKGVIELELFAEQTPNTAANFAKFAESGFYDGTRFHRVIKGFMIQGGDPLSKDVSMKDGWGTGGPGYQFADEIGPDNRNSALTIAMANAGPNTNGSQFFINAVDNSYLDTKHTVFGKVVSGAEVVRAIENVATEGPNRPIDDVVIEKLTILSPQ